MKMQYENAINKLNEQIQEIRNENKYFEQIKNKYVYQSKKREEYREAIRINKQEKELLIKRKIKILRKYGGTNEYTG